MNYSSNAPVEQSQLRSIVERIERMHEERKAIADDIAEIYAEAKANGFDVKVLREVIRIRSKDAAELSEHHAILDLYLTELGGPHVHVHASMHERDA
jgi:uncharacterized protein (UPF0335 family)